MGMGQERKECSENEKGNKLAFPQSSRQGGEKGKKRKTPTTVQIQSSSIEQDGSSQRVLRPRLSARQNISHRDGTQDTPDLAVTQGSKRAALSPSQRFPHTDPEPPRPAVDYHYWPADRIRKLRQVPEEQWFPHDREPHAHDSCCWTVVQKDLYLSFSANKQQEHRVLSWDRLKTATRGRDIKRHFSHIHGLDKIVSKSEMKHMHDDTIHMFFATLWVAPDRSYIRFMYGDEPRRLTKSELADALGIHVSGESLHNLAYQHDHAHAGRCRQKCRAEKPQDHLIRSLFTCDVGEGLSRHRCKLTHEATVTLNAIRFSVLPRFGYRDGFTPMLQWVLYHLMNQKPFDFIDLMICEMEDVIYDSIKRRLPYGPYILMFFDKFGRMPSDFCEKLQIVRPYQVPGFGDKRLGPRTNGGLHVQEHACEDVIGDRVVASTHETADSDDSPSPCLPSPCERQDYEVGNSFQVHPTQPQQRPTQTQPSKEQLWEMNTSWNKLLKAVNDCSSMQEECTTMVFEQLSVLASKVHKIEEHMALYPAAARSTQLDS